MSAILLVLALPASAAVPAYPPTHPIFLEPNVSEDALEHWATTAACGTSTDGYIPGISPNLHGIDDVDRLIEQYDLALGEFYRGNPEPVQKLWCKARSRRTLFWPADAGAKIARGSVVRPSGFGEKDT